MIEQIKAEARRQLAEQGPGAVSLRAIARELGTASSALFRYFPSQHDLITALVVDAYDSLADTLTAAVAAQPPADHAGRWLAICRAYRRWALADTAGFALIHGTPLPGYQAPAEITGPPAGRSLRVALDAYTAAVRSGAADPGRTQVPGDLRTGPLLAGLLPGRERHHEARLAAIVLNARASLMGYLMAEIFGSLPDLVSDTEALYHAHVRSVMLAMGYRPALVERLDT
jgi:AcrR family transcriptional regulator